MLGPPPAQGQVLSSQEPSRLLAIRWPHGPGPFVCVVYLGCPPRQVPGRLSCQSWGSNLRGQRLCQRGSRSRSRRSSGVRRPCHPARHGHSVVLRPCTGYLSPLGLSFQIHNTVLGVSGVAYRRGSTRDSAPGGSRPLFPIHSSEVGLAPRHLGNVCHLEFKNPHLRRHLGPKQRGSTLRVCGVQTWGWLPASVFCAETRKSPWDPSQCPP